MYDAIWAAEKATEKAKLDWEEVSAVLVELKFKPAVLNFKAWLWASATVSIISDLYECQTSVHLITQY